MSIYLEFWRVFSDIADDRMMMVVEGLAGLVSIHITMPRLDWIFLLTSVGFLVLRTYAGDGGGGIPPVPSGASVGVPAAVASTPAVWKDTRTLSAGSSVTVTLGTNGWTVRWVPPGRFVMGSAADEANRDKDEVQHEVEFSRGFFMAETECTQAQWEAIMPKNPSHGKAPDQPVNQVNWREAQDYCRALTERHRAQGLIPAGWEWDLPTEAQWEYACRAGTTGAFAGDLPSLAWIESNSEGKPHAVKTRQPNAWGLHDLHGNVWEWCRDWYGDYATHRGQDPTGPSAGTFRCYRGGSRIYGARRARSAIRGAMTPEMRGDYLGFRPVLLPSP
jgi:formylglycine-generating enzyme required for sulfatase activity